MRAWLTFFALLAGACPALADSPYPYKKLGYCQLSVTTSVLTSTCAGYPADAGYAAICNEGAAARWRDDGTAPTASVGAPLPAGTASAPSCMSYSGSPGAVAWIAQSGTATLNFTFYK